MGSNGKEGESKKQELSAKPFPSMQALAESQLFQAQMKTVIGSSLDGTGAQITYRGEGDTLVMDIALPAGYDQHDSASRWIRSIRAACSSSSTRCCPWSLPSPVRNCACSFTPATLPFETIRRLRNKPRFLELRVACGRCDSTTVNGRTRRSEDRPAGEYERHTGRTRPKQASIASPTPVRSAMFPSVRP